MPAQDEPTEPTEQTEPIDDRQALRDLLAPVRTVTWVAMAIAAVATAAEVVPYLAIGELARTILADGEPDRGRLLWIALVVILALLVRALGSSAAIMITHYADVRLQAILRRRMVTRLGRVRLGWFTEHASADVGKAAQQDVHAMHYLVAHQKVETVSGIVGPVVGFGCLLYLAWPAALLVLVPIVLYLLAFGFMMRDAGTKMRDMDESSARVNAAAVEFVRGIAVVKTFGRTGQSHQAYERATKDYARFFEGWVRPLLRLESLSAIALSAPFVLALTLGGGLWFLHQGWMDPVDLLVAAMIGVNIPGSITPLLQGIQGRQQATAAAGRVAALLRTETLPEPITPQHPDGRTIEIDSVTFSYDRSSDDEHPAALRDVNLTLSPGTVTALVGPSGSGKSTLAALLLRFHDVTDGQIRIGGADLRSIRAEELYRTVGFVLQDVALLHGTIADNIALGEENPSRDRIEAAARAARIHDRIIELPRGYDSVIGEDALLSGGEAQRVSIARVILRDTPIVILDEATAHADPESEAAVQQSLSALAEGRTVLVIAHRLDTIHTADQIVVLRKGLIEQTGRHDDLVHAPGLYADLWRASHEEAGVTS